MNTRLKEIVESSTVLAFVLWVEGRRDNEDDRLFAARDDCKCPLAQWYRSLCDEEVAVSDDGVYDSEGTGYITDLPAWASLFVNLFDTRFDYHSIDAPALLAFVREVQPYLEKSNDSATNTRLD